MPQGHPEWAHLRQTWGILTVPDFLKHLFNKHDGEVRVVKWAGWTRLPLSSARDPRFWHPQFARTEATRQLMYWRRAKDPDQPLTWQEIKEILEKSPEGQTTLIRRVPPAASGAPDDGNFQVEVRKAQVVTLAEVFAMGSPFCTAYDMYKHYMDLEILVHKQKRECKDFVAYKTTATRDEWQALHRANKRARTKL